MQDFLSVPLLRVVVDVSQEVDIVKSFIMTLLEVKFGVGLTKQETSSAVRDVTEEFEPRIDELFIELGFAIENRIVEMFVEQLQKSGCDAKIDVSQTERGISQKTVTIREDLGIEVRGD